MTGPFRIDGTDAAESLNGSAGDDLIFGYDAAAATASVTGIELRLLNPDAGGKRPLDIVSNGVDGQHVFLVAQAGRIDILDTTTGAIGATPLLDLTGQIYFQGDMGLHAVAFDPDFANNGRFYVIVGQDYGGGEIRQEIWSYSVLEDNRLAADTSTAQMIASWPSTTVNHRVANIQFGPDGYLYVTRGDGFNPNDGLHTAQDPFNLQGKMLRLDVSSGIDDFPDDPQRNYAIPEGNFFSDTLEGAPEVYYVGLRNTWRSSFDRVTGDFWAGEVGGRDWEELDYLPAGTGPVNLGWGFEGWEGNFPVNPDGPTIPTTGLTFPVYTYFHDDRDGQYAITGGYVYRGPNAAMQGEYLFGDFGQAFLRTTHVQGTIPWTVTDWTDRIVYTDAGDQRLDRLPSFGQDAEGNLFVVDIDNNIFRLEFIAAPPPTGNNVIAAGDGDDWVFAGDADDSVLGEAGDDTLSGMAGEDTLVGGQGDDSLIGGQGDDVLIGHLGADTLLGGEGDDTLAGGAGNDALDGGVGLLDVATFSGNRRDYLIKGLYGGALTLTDLRAEAPDGVDQLRGIEFLRFADGDEVASDYAPISTPTSGADYLAGTAGKDGIDGLAGNDTIVGLAGKDALNGGRGNDSIDGAEGPNRLTGGSGDDTLDGGNGRGDVAVFSGNRADYLPTFLDGGVIRMVDLRAGSPDGTDLVRNIETFAFADGDILADNLFGPPGTATAGADVLLGTSAANAIGGLGGSDTVRGFANRDTLDGGAGDDSIQGGDGADRITGGLGSDVLEGGNEADRFFYVALADSTVVAPDEIVDFAPGIDKLSLKVAAKGLAFIGQAAFSGADRQVRYETSGPDTLVQVDADGDGRIDMLITLLQVSRLEASDFML